MKITSVDIIAIKKVVLSEMRPVIVRVNTDEGFYGLGEIGVAIVTGAYGALEVIKDFVPMIIGMDPFDTEVIWQKLHMQTFWAIGNGGVVMSAVSAIDTALWDLKARALGLPLYKLLGGKQREKLHAYASQLQFGWNVDGFTLQHTPEGYAEMARRAVADGFDTIKANVIKTDRQGNNIEAKDWAGLATTDYFRIAEERLAAMRDAVGPKVDIILENHATTDTVSGIRIGQMAEAYDVILMEEPANPLNIDNFIKIAANTSIPLATGERSYTRWGFKDLITSGALAVIQPDIGNCGGVSEFKKIADFAKLYDVGVQAHVCSSPISVAVSLQLEAVIPNFAIHEHHVTNTTKEVTEMCIYDYQPINGFFEIPELPGIGQDLSKKALAEASIITMK
ncbi:MAG: mandelate racemase/muconate lactonizing enzyme family protein [Lachnospiraceae bacterium]|nr:mandelate racemase/muconate lactonizing enzyme family protein [Lachnospiraceae bacterium]